MDLVPLDPSRRVQRRARVPGLLSARVEGRDPLPLEGGVLLASTRCGMLDPWLLNFAAGRAVHLATPSPLFLLPGLGELATALGAVPIPPDLGGGDPAPAAMAEALDAGYAVGTFLDFTVDEEGLHLEPGMIEILLATRSAGIPVVPIAIHGSGRRIALGESSWLPAMLQEALSALPLGLKPELHADYAVRLGSPVWWGFGGKRPVTLQDFMKEVGRSLSELL